MYVHMYTFPLQDIGLFWAFVIIIVVFGGSMGIAVVSVKERVITSKPPKFSENHTLNLYKQFLYLYIHVKYIHCMYCNYMIDRCNYYYYTYVWKYIFDA